MRRDARAAGLQLDDQVREGGAEVRRSGLRLGVAVVLLLAGAGLIAAAETRPATKSPLQEAILAGDNELARELVNEGASASEGLITAARTGDVSFLEYLLASGADASSFFGARALVVAILVEDEEATALLKSSGAHLEARDEAGRTVLVWASGEKRLGPLVRTAIGAGADVDAASRTGESALMTAARFGRTGSVRTLLKAGASVDAADRDGWTPLMFAVRSQSMKIVHVLLDAGADPEAESTLGWTPLMLAAWEGKPKIVNRLLRAGADVEHRTDAQGKPLVRAIQGGHVPVVRRLLALGADVGNGTDGDPEWWAWKLGQRRIRKLLEARAGGGG